MSEKLMLTILTAKTAFRAEPDDCSYEKAHRKRFKDRIT